MKTRKIFILAMLLVAVITLFSLAKFNRDNITFHIHDTYIIAGYTQIIYFFSTIAGLIFLFRILFKSSR